MWCSGSAAWALEGFFPEARRDAPQRMGVAEAKANFSALVTDVNRTGTPCVVMRYNKPLVLIVPARGKDEVVSRGARGSLADFAATSQDPARLDAEKDAFRKAMVSKHANAS